MHTQLSSAAGRARAVHTTYIQQEVLHYIEPSSETSLGFYIPASLSKEERGLENHVTARFLIPRQHLEAFEKDPDRSATLHHYHPQLTSSHSVIARFRDQDSDLSLIAEDWPTFLYDELTGWNQNDIRKGLFRGHILVRVSVINSKITHTRPVN